MNGKFPAASVLLAPSHQESTFTNDLTYILTLVNNTAPTSILHTQLAKEALLQITLVRSIYYTAAFVIAALGIKERICTLYIF